MQRVAARTADASWLGLRLPALALPQWVSVFSVVLLLGSGCSTMQVTTLKQRSTESCEYHAEQKGVVVGIHPVIEEREMEEIFKMDLREKGLLPILLVVDNRSASSFIIAKDKVRVGDETSGAFATSQRTNLTSQAAGMGGALILVGSAVGGLLLEVVGFQLASDAGVIQHNLADKEFCSRTLAPSQSAQGFIYFRLSKGTSLVGNYHVLVDLKDSSSGDVLPFDFAVDLTSRQR
jgi:hypothetical protein